MPLTPDELETFLDLMLAEDIGSGDVTSEAVIPSDAQLNAAFVARQPLVVAGLSVTKAIIERLVPRCTFIERYRDGDIVEPGCPAIAEVSGGARGLLTAERSALNILQHLSGIATLTRHYVRAIDGTDTKVLDTRKTIPGLRKLEKYAVKMGGGTNHRMGLYDAVMIKDNHIAVAGSISAAIKAVRAHTSLMIQVECDTLDQVGEALAACADSLLLDNMSLGALREAVALNAGKVSLEASGGVTLETVRDIAETGVEFISIGRLTQSAPAVDIGLDYESGADLAGGRD